MPPAVTATVLIPTHDHASLLPYAVGSVLRQSISDFELFVVGDGAGPATRRAVEALARDDARIRYFDFPKGERHGELNRHTALAEARGRIVAYCSDDDLWLEDHLANLAAGLEGADFTHTLQSWITAEGEVVVVPADLAAPQFRNVMAATRTNYFGPTVVGHTLAAYRALPVGWHPAPPDVWTDLHMWRQFIALDGLRFRTVPVVDTVHFPASARPDWSPQRRLAEIEDFAAALAAPGGVATYRQRAVGALVGKLVAREHRAIRRRLAKAAIRRFATGVFRRREPAALPKSNQPQ
jgi:glycosyltransferase involved in cell wall biosynthesis